MRALFAVAVAAQASLLRLHSDETKPSEMECIMIEDQATCISHQHCGWMMEDAEFGSCIQWDGATMSDNGKPTFADCPKWQAALKSEGIDGVCPTPVEPTKPGCTCPTCPICPTPAPKPSPPPICPRFDNTFKANWWGSMDNTGWSRTNSSIIRGFYLTRHGGGQRLYNLEVAIAYSIHGASKMQVMHTSSLKGVNPEYSAKYNWQVLLDRNNTGAYCPPGWFLSGLYRSGRMRGAQGGTWRLENAECAKPFESPSAWGNCIESHDLGLGRNGGTGTCPPDYGVVGILRGKSPWLDEMHVKCCKLGSPKNCPQ